MLFRSRVGSPQTFFERNITGLKGLLPFVQYSLQANEIDVDRTFATYLRAARLREELRLNIIREVASELLEGLLRKGILPILLRGYPLAETIYPEPYLRHCHGLHILVQDVAEAVRAVGSKFTRVACPIFTAQGVLLKHSSRLPVAMSSRLVQIPGNDRLTTLARSRAVFAELATPGVRRLTAADAFVDICANAALSSGRSNLRWVVDAMLLLRSTPPSAWALILDAVASSRVALALLHMVEYLRHALDAAISREMVEQVNDLALTSDPVALDALLLAARRGSRERFSNIMEALPDRRSRLRLIRALVLPRLSLLRWAYPNLPEPLAPTLYLWHPMSLALRRMHGPKPISDDLVSERLRA